MNKSSPNLVLILGSAPDAIKAQEWQRDIFTSIVAINNAWQIREDWDYLIYPDDLPVDRLPRHTKPSQHAVTSASYVPAQNHFGGFVYAGGTMCFTAAYWALHTLKPDIIAFVGCDMVYPKEGLTHFYGAGTADPLRDDITLQSLEAKSARLQILALENESVCINLSSLAESRLVFPRVSIEDLFDSAHSVKKELLDDVRAKLLAELSEPCSQKNMETAKAKEFELGYYIESGKYWQHLDTLNAKELSLLDQYWLSAYLAQTPLAKNKCLSGN